MSEWTRERINPVAWLEENGVDCSHIEYDPKLRRGDYSINRGSAHDGTSIFTRELFANSLKTLAFGASFDTRKGWHEGMRYRVGPMRVATVYGLVNLPCGKFPGQRKRVRIPVIALT